MNSTQIHALQQHALAHPKADASGRLDPRLMLHDGNGISVALSLNK